jgi:KUP system potassium uptake protein
LSVADDQLAGHAHGQRPGLLVVSLGALGVVYGDIGTSPLYAIRESFHGDYGIDPVRGNVLGVLSLVFWALLIVVSVKYLAFIMRADNDGEGGVLALTALIAPERRNLGRLRAGLIAAGLFAAALLYSDGIITPAISVLSAVEGLELMAPGLDAWVIPITVVILLGLFLIQSKGTARVGALFGPVMLIWFATLGALGVGGIVRAPEVLEALSPAHGAEFLARSGLHGFLVLGAVFLVVTGAEALYADMGHFGPGPIRLSWFAVALPGLLLNYFGQGALLLRDPHFAHQPFYSLAPESLRVPLLFLATFATIIASQAVISGAFSLTRQAVQMGYLPRMEIIHTSSSEIGQIYVPVINWVLMLATIALVLSFKSSSHLAAAYGVAVVTTMLTTSILFFVVSRERWRWPRWKSLGLTGGFLVVDLAFFGANLTKIAHGAWLPLMVAAMVYLLLSTWRGGRELLGRRLADTGMSVQRLMKRITAHPPVRVAGKAIFMTSHPSGVPPALVHNLRHNKVLHQEVVFLTISSQDVPRVPEAERVEVHPIGGGIFRVVARYGFAETASITEVLRLMRRHGLSFGFRDTAFFVGREGLLPRGTSGMSVWRERVFMVMSRNAYSATDYYGIPPEQVVVLGAQLEI